MTTLHIDFETRSELDLKKVGLYNYARHPSTDVWCMAWALGDMEPELWIPNWQYDRCVPPSLGIMCDLPEAIVSHVADGGKVMAHNAPFELAIWNHILHEKHGIIFPLQPEQTHCTMAQCYAMGLPGALEDAALALGLHVLKDTEGRALMLRMSRPRSTKPTIWWSDEDKLKRLYAYCQQDVRVERELEKRLLPLSDKERQVWLMDYEINQRGVAVDLDTARAAVTMAETVKEKCSDELTQITGGAVQSVTAVAAFKEWIAAQGVAVDSLAKQDVIDLLDTVLPDPVHRALVLRQEAGKASTAKLDRMVGAAGEDGRLRNLYQYHGAATGRWAGRGVQVHNLPRDMPSRDTVERILSFVRSGEHAAIDLIYGPPITMISKCLRSFFVAPPGKMLVSGDWSNVEGRGQAWFAGEQWKLDAFRAADAGTGPGLYELAYSRMFNVPVESVKNPSEERQVGKVSELAFGYQGGKGSFAKMGKNYNIKVEPAKAEEFKIAWRAAHPRIVQCWYDIQRAAINAVQKPGEKFTCGAPGRHATFKMAGSFLFCRLPSGRVNCYPYPKILQDEYGPKLTYMTVPGPDTEIVYDPKNTSNWARVSTYGGALFNNIVQGFCRDFLADCMLALREKGAQIVLHTHDSLSLEVAAEKAERVRNYMEQVMCVPPAWAQGFPLIAKPEVMVRYDG